LIAMTTKTQESIGEPHPEGGPHQELHRRRLHEQAGAAFSLPPHENAEVHTSVMAIYADDGKFTEPYRNGEAAAVQPDLN